MAIVGKLIISSAISPMVVMMIICPVIIIPIGCIVGRRAQQAHHLKYMGRRKWHG